MKKTYIGFYTSLPFWADSKPDLSEYSDTNFDTSGFLSKMSEFTFNYSNKSFSLAICKDGLIQYTDKEFSQFDTESMNNLKEKWSYYLSILNTLYLLFESAFLEIENHAYFDIHEITINDTISTTYKGGKFLSQSVPFKSYASIRQKKRWLSSFTQPELKNLEFTFNTEPTTIVKKKVFTKLVKNFEIIYKSPFILKQLSDLTKALSELKNTNFDTSLVISWFILERFINRNWNKFLTSKNKNIEKKIKRINAIRRLKLKNGNVYTSAVKLNILELADILDYKTYKEIDEIRVARNKIIHVDEDFKASYQDCTKAFDIIRNLIEHEFKIEVKLNTGYSLAGI